MSNLKFLTVLFGIAFAAPGCELEGLIGGDKESTTDDSDSGAEESSSSTTTSAGSASTTTGADACELDVEPWDGPGHFFAVCECESCSIEFDNISPETTEAFFSSDDACACICEANGCGDVLGAGGEASGGAPDTDASTTTPAETDDGGPDTDASTTTPAETDGEGPDTDASTTTPAETDGGGPDTDASTTTPADEG